MDLVNEWIAAYRATERAQEKLNALTAQLLPTMAVGDTLDGKTAKVRKRDRAVLQPKDLQAAISTSLWTKITERKPVAAYYNEAIKRGQLTQEIMDGCSTRSKAWLELL
jgi:hypothetical protein